METTVREPLPGTDVTEIGSGRVRIRVFARADLDRRCAWPRFEDPVFAHLNLNLATPAQREVWFHREWTARRPYWFAVESIRPAQDPEYVEGDETGELIGSITLREASRWRRSARLGIHLHPARLDRGYGTETMQLFLDYYFNRLGWGIMKLDVAAWNRRAIRCYEKVGFAFQWEFWRPNESADAWLVDDRYAHVREHVERRQGIEQVRHYEMRLDAQTFRRLQAAGQSPAAR